jgi:hypothetical protein
MAGPPAGHRQHQHSEQVTPVGPNTGIERAMKMAWPGHLSGEMNAAWKA